MGRYGEDIVYMAKKYTLTEKLHIFKMASPWIYIPIPLNMVPNIKPGGWGSIPVIATIGKTTWQTSLFPIKKGHYFIPIKKEVRVKEDLFVGDKVTISY